MALNDDDIDDLFNALVDALARIARAVESIEEVVLARMEEDDDE